MESATARTWRGEGGWPATARDLTLRMLDRYGIIPLLFLIMFLVFSLSSDRFATVDNLSNLGRQAAILMVLTMGQTLYLVTRNYDLSNGVTVALTSVVSALVMTWDGFGGHTWLAITMGVLAGIGVGFGIGVVNGVAVAFGLSSFMVTLAMASIAFGAALILSNGTPVTGLPEAFTGTLGLGDWIGIPVPIVCTVVLLIGFYFLMNWLVLGRYAYAIGSNQEAARVSGIPLRLTMVKLLVLGSVLAAIAGVMLTARIASGEATLGPQFPLLSIAAAVLGGVSLMGGVGRVSGIIMAVIFIQMISNGMNLVRISSYIQLIVFGGLLLFAIAFDRIRAQYLVRS